MEKSSLIALANTLFWMGRLEDAQNSLNEYQQLEKQHTEDDNEDDQNRLFSMMFSYLIAHVNNDLNALSCLKTRLKEIIKESKNQVTICLALQGLAWKACISDENEDMAEFAPAFLEVASRSNLIFYEGMANIFNGYYISNNDCEKGIESIKNGYKMIQDHNQCEVVVTHSIYGLLLSRCYLKIHDYVQFQTFIDIVITNAEERGERLYLDMLYKLKSEFLEESGQAGHTKFRSTRVL
jgi:hypothetical protein